MTVCHEVLSQPVQLDLHHLNTNSSWCAQAAYQNFGQLRMREGVSNLQVQQQLAADATLTSCV